MTAGLRAADTPRSGVIAQLSAVSDTSMGRLMRLAEHGMAASREQGHDLISGWNAANSVCPT